MSFPRIITYHTSDFFFFFFLGTRFPPFPQLHCFQLSKHANDGTTFYFARLSITSQIMQSASFIPSCFMLCIPSYPCHKTTTTSRCSDIPTYLYPYISGTYCESFDVPPLPLPSPPIPNWTLQLDLPLSIWLLGECIGILRAVMDLCLSLHLS